MVPCFSNVSGPLHKIFLDALQTSVWELAMKCLDYHEYTPSPHAITVTNLGSVEVDSNQEIVHGFR